MSSEVHFLNADVINSVNNSPVKHFNYDGLVEATEIDENEFDLPQFDEDDLPSLESLLAEEDNDISNEDVNLFSSHLPFLKTTLGIESSQSSDRQSIHSDLSDNIPKFSDKDAVSFTASVGTVGSDSGTQRGSCNSKNILHQADLHGITSQLASAQDRVNTGFPTAMAVSNLICIGTSHGYILVFEQTQAMKWCLGSAQLGEQHGSVSAMSVNEDASRLLVGYAKGHICLFDLGSGKLVQNIPNAHTPFTAVLHLKWMNYPGLAVISDSGGSVYELGLKRSIGMTSNESRCIFSGSRGEVCSLEPVPMAWHLGPEFIGFPLVALATISKVMVVCLRPSLRVLFTHPLLGSPSSLPQLSWQFSVIQMPGSVTVVDPVLAFARDTVVYLYQVSTNLHLETQAEMQFIRLHELRLNFSVVSLSWMSPRCLGLVDGKEQLRLIDVRTRIELEILDLSPLGLVYSSPHFKAIATGGNVSKAMSVGGERACYNSVVSFRCQVALLGTKSVQMVTMRTWVSRLDHLAREGHLSEALHLALDIYKDQALAVVGLTHKKHKKRELIERKVTELLHSHLSMLDTHTGKIASGQEDVVVVCVRVCVELNLKEELFGQVWETFNADAQMQAIFLRSLQPYIVSGQLSQVSPSITQCLLSHLEACGNFEALEASIVHLTIDSLDVHQAMTMCRAHSLYDAIFYVYTQGIGDYIAPLEEQMTKLQEKLEMELPAGVRGEQLSESTVILGNKIMVYISCCLAGRAFPQGEISPEEGRRVKHEMLKRLTSLHSPNPNQGERPHPWLRTLLHFDTAALLSVVALAFQEEEFKAELGARQRQRLVDILINIMMEDTCFSPGQIGSLFSFIVRQMNGPPPTIEVQRNFFEKAVNYLMDERDESFHEECQTALLKFLQAGGMSYCDVDSLLEKAIVVLYHRVCEYLYDLKGEYEKAVQCYLNDVSRQQHVFAYIRSYLSGHQSIVVQKIQDVIQLHIMTLVDIDTNETAALFIQMSEPGPLLLSVLENLKDRPRHCFQILHYIFINCRSNDDDGNFLITFGELSSELEEIYIRLLCEFQPDLVLNFLKKSCDYNLENILKIVEEFSLQNAVAYLLESLGDWKGAFQALVLLIQDIIIKAINGTADQDTTPILDQIHFQVCECVRLGHSGSGSLGVSECSDLWFSLLVELLGCQSSPVLGIEVVEECIGLVVTNMMAYIPLHIILDRVIQIEGNPDATLASIRYLLKAVMDQSRYEETLYNCITQILREDGLKLLQMRCDQNRIPVQVNSTVCQLCLGNFQCDGDVLAFGCGHSFHETCCDEDTTCCSVCNNKLHRQTYVESVPPPENVEVHLSENQLKGLNIFRKLTMEDSRLKLLQ